MKRLYKKSLYKIFVSLFIIFYSFLPQTIVIGQVLEEYSQENAAPIEEVITPEESLSQEEVVLPEEVLPPVVEEPLTQPVVEPEEVIKEVMHNPTWVINGNTATTFDTVQLGKTYISPQNSKVRVFFTKLPENPSTLTIEEITLTQEEIKATGAISDKAYDIKTDMIDGTFEYDLTLPSTQEDTKVVYAEHREDIFTDLKEVTNTIVNEGDTLKIEDLEHFTIFIVKSPDETISDSGVGNENNAWVSDNNYATFDNRDDYAVYGFPDLGIPSGANIEGIEVLVEGKTTGRDLDISIWNQSNSSPDAYTSTKTADLSSSESTVIIGGSADKWGKSWIDTDFNTDFKIRVDANWSIGGGTASLDQIRVKVSYSMPLTPPTLTNDSSDPVALTSVGGVWTSIDGGSGHTGINTSEIRWGTPAGSQKSGLRFTNSGLQSFDTGETFYLGMLTHMNWGTNSGTAASGATLQLTLNFDRPNIPDVVLDYDFDIEETLNSAGNCMPYQISNTPCDDKITFPSSYGTQVFTIGDIQYTLVIDGFVNAYPSGNAVSAFITEEEKENSAFLVGHLSSVLVEKPEIRLTKKTNDQDIASAPGQNLYVGDTVEWKYIIQNSGNVDLTNVSITDSPSANIDCDSVTSGLQNSGLTLASGETVTCTASGTVGAGSYSNTATATGTHSSGTVTASDTSWYTGINKSHLIVQKTTVPASDPTTFGISISTTNGTVFEDVNGSISDSTDYDYTVSAGTYSITETVPTGWQKTGDTCQNVTVGIGETKTCTITNTKDTGTLIVKKVVNNNYGGTLSFSDFSFKINGGNDISFESDGQNDIEVNTGKYSVVENSKTGYQTTYDNCSDIQIDPGETETCTITNSDIQPKLTVTKIVSGGTKVVGDFELLVNSTSVVSGVQNGFNAGTYTVNETPDSDYTAVISGDCASNGLITLNVGDEKECTITNTRDTGNLKVVKTVDYGNASDWYFSLNGGNPIQADSNGVVDFGQVDTNQNHTIVESGPLGIFYLGSITGTNCTPNIGNKSATATVTKDATTTCTFSNLVNRGSISIIKDSIPNDSQDFSFITTGAGLSSFSLDDDQDSTLSNTKTFTSLLPGTYTITEVGAEGWDFTKVQCVSNKSIDTLSFDNIVSLNLQAGENVTCTFTNTKKGKIILEKQVLPDGNSQTFSFTGELAGTIGDGQQLSKQVVPGTYTVSESPFSTSGYRLTDIACDDIDSTYDISTGTTTFNVEAGETVKCIYTNEIFGSVTAHKYHDLDEDKEQSPAEPNLSGWEMSLYNGNDCQGDPYMQGVTNSSGDITFNSIIPGDYSVMETLQSGWENVSDICQNFTVTPAEKEIVNFANIELKPITINAHKIECTNELELPNWGNGGDNIDENTALNWVKNHSSCSFKQGHSFQWGNEGPSSMNPGDNTGETTDTRWHTFGATDTNGLATIEIANKDIEGFNSIWIREVWNSDYIPFTYNIEGGNNSNNVTAEIYCHTDVLNYDNLDRIDGIENGETYYCVAWNVEANPEIEVEKSGPDYAINGENITYEYEVTNKGNVPLSNISVVDDKCNPVVYQSGDDGDNILENGEEWKYQCTTNILWTFPDSFTNEAAATGSFYDEETTDSDEFTLYPFTLRKDVLLYWDGDKIDYSDPETEFTVDIKKGDEVLGTETITESLPINLWLSEGSYKFCEKDLPEGYIQGYECIDYTTGQRYPDWSQINVITFDLAIDKIAPSVAYKGETITYEYEVKNGGPANVTPMVKDDLCTPVEYDSGDINMDGKIDSNETWKFTCDYKVTESGGSEVTNIAEVYDIEGESWNYDEWYLGGDRDIENNTDTETVKVKAGSIRVCKVALTPDGKITDGSELPGYEFSVKGLDVTTSQGAPVGVLPETSYSTPLDLNTDVYSSSEGNDLYCKTYSDLPIGHFYYSQETYSSPWNIPRYNDSNLNLNQAIDYSGQLFDEDPSNDGQRNTIGDGDILLTTSRADRTLLVVNQYPYSSIQGRKYYDVNINGNFDKEEKINKNKLDNWTINLYNQEWDVLGTMKTGDDTTDVGNVEKGQYRFENLLPGTYYVCEQPQEGWYQTEPYSGVQNPQDNSFCHTVVLGASEDKVGVQFGNYQGSDVKICKKNHNNKSLSGWDMVLASDKVDGPTALNVSNNSGSNSSNLPAGTYLIKVSGTYRYGNTQMIADAGYSFRPIGIPYGTGGWVSGLDLPSKGLMALINGSSVNWGAYNSSHEYTYVYDHLGGPINVSIYDDYYADNVNKDFRFEVYKVNEWAKGSTERNGCTTLEAIPYGEYILDEYLKEGWIDISGKGTPVVVDEMEENFTIKNRVNQPVTIEAMKVVCDNESYLPNWGRKGPAKITSNTAQNWVDESEGHCRLEPTWEFEWGYQGAGNPGDEYIGYGGEDWNTFSAVGEEGIAIAKINNLKGSRIELREVLQENYIPFTYNNNNNSDDFSAEFYCDKDVANYDNWEWLNRPEYGQTYYCVAFNTQSTGDIHGYKWSDINGDGERNCIGEEMYDDVRSLAQNRAMEQCELEPLLGNWKIFIDENENSQFDEGERYMLTDNEDHLGWYWFEDLKLGEYTVCEELQDGWVQTYPINEGNNCHTITLPDENPKGFLDQVNAVEGPTYNFGNLQKGSITVYKFNDLNGNGVLDEGESYLSDWEMNMSKVEAEEYNQMTGIDGSTTFNLLPDSYVLSETMQDGWAQTGIYCEDNREGVKITLPGCAYGHHGACSGWNQCGNAATCAQKACEANGYQYLVSYGDQRPCTQFNNCSLFYNISDNLSYQANWGNWCDVMGVTDIYCSNGSEVSRAISSSNLEDGVYNDNAYNLRVSPGDNKFCYVGNVQRSELYISKTNDSWPNILAIGDTVTYTIDIRAAKSPVSDVVLTDLPPEGFIPQPGTFSAISSVRGTLDTSGVMYSSPGKWELGKILVGEIVTITYKALVTDLVDAGKYPDLAYAKGIGIMGSNLLAISEGSGFEINDGIVGKYFVGTQVKVENDPEIEEGEVLGAAITLPRTGADTYITLGALISMILGFILLVFNPKKRIKNLFIAGVVLFSMFFILKPLPTYASVADIDVRIEQPVTPTNKNTFKIGFVALDLQNRTVTVECYKDGILFGTYATNSGNCEVTPALVTTSGTYDFYVKAKAGGDENISSTVSVEVVLEKPLPVINYAKTEGTCKYTLSFKTANDGRTSKVEIFRSSTQPFTANASTLIHTETVGPNTPVTYTDSSITDCAKEYYYAIRSIDDYNNVSTLVTDNIVTIVTTPATITPTPIEGNEEEGEVAGEETTPEKEQEQGEVKGEEEKETENGEEGGEKDNENSAKSIWSNYKYFIIAVLVVALGSGAYKYVRRKK